ncbi:cytochrome o ubiquinol oxidase subunit IV [Erwinia aphidicola]|uniref:cytochrome o ubiquinol oxidase subunit IV n=1 Tax=Erwinia aphidicola TaxID=68334 RepID=UPI0030D0E7AB
MSHPATEHGASHGSVKSYMIGFILSIILTGIPFWMVMDGGASKATILAVVLVCAVVQCAGAPGVLPAPGQQVRGGWNLIAIVFAALIILIVVVGSLWIMWNLNYNMMSH